ncbi:pre-mRNA splicing factor [Purpureocillium lavendulum]|uniref:Pre-mRNA splicing factor n=1 Tax=Purpureocillium lavendulum TaxID=1247861 RepID=A0AB34FXV1_9HYPO|nr:pre-mRNA splicing factor [Purpureocillium lavendulum]
MARTYNIDKSLFKQHFRIAPTTQPPLSSTTSPLDSGLYAPIAAVAISRTVPFVALHAGPDASPSSPVIGVSHYPAFSKHFKLGLAPESHKSLAAAEGLESAAGRDMLWEELRMETSNGSRHAWSMLMPVEGDLTAGGVDSGPAGHGAHERKRRTFVWKRTHSVAVDGMHIAPLSTRNWKLVEQPADGSGRGTHRPQSPEVGEAGEDKATPLAVFTTSTQRGRCGVLQINVDYGSGFDTMLLLALLTLYCSGR